jgi:transglutaminase-like putative cysteine protease
MSQDSILHSGGDSISRGMQLLCVLLFACMVLLNTGEIYAQNTQGEEALLPDNMTVKTCSTVMESDSTVAVVNASAEANRTLDSAAGPSVSRADVEDAAVRVNTFLARNKRLPLTVEVGSVKVNMAQFLQLEAYYVLNRTPTVNQVQVPAKTSGTMLKGSIYLKDYLEVAGRVLSSGAPEYIGFRDQKIGFESLVWLFARAINFKVANQRLPNHIKLDALNSVESSTPTGNNSGSSDAASGNSGFTREQILAAANSLKSYIDRNQSLPGYVQVANQRIGIAQFLHLMVKCLNQINLGKNTPIAPVTAGEAANPAGDASGTLTRSEYLKVASTVQGFMEKNHRAPNYAGSSKGRISYESLVYSISRILSFYSKNGRLPKTVTVTRLASSLKNRPENDPYSGESTARYLASSANCPVDSPEIRSLASEITGGLTSTFSRAEAIFGWVRDNINYSFYYNTKYGAVGTLKNRTGNCVDHAHLLVALARAAGIPARYVHGTCNFTSGNVYGHVWAQLLVGDTWYAADATSSRNSLGVVNNWNTSSAVIKGIYASLPF